MDRLGTNVYAKVCQIAGDLDKLILLGTITIYKLPSANFGYCGVKAPDGWHWLDLEFISAVSDDTQLVLSPLIQCLRFLVGYKYISCTYRLFAINGTQLVRVRIYAIPSDLSGFRFVNIWRHSRSNYSQLGKNGIKNWHHLLEILDFSSDNWHVTKNGFHDKGMILVPLDCAITSKGTLSLHLDRWYKGKSYNILLASERELTPSLSDRIQQLYGSITSPNMTKYASKSVTNSFQHLRSPHELLEQLVNHANDGTVCIDGVKAQLYPYQIISMARMYEKETIPQYHYLPGLLEFKSAKGQIPYFVNVNTFSFYRRPDLIRLPRGGILAENMGLGKTLICLSLICLTKNDVSEVPHDLLLYREDDDPDLIVLPKSEIGASRKASGYIKSLVNTCVRFINDNSLPWKYFINDIPSEVVHRLRESPGSFKIKLDYNEYDSVFAVTKRRSIRRKQIAMDDLPEGNLYRKVYLCSTTIIVVPENLFHQWSSELSKHVRDNCLKKLFLSSHFRSDIKGNYTTFMNDVTLDPLELIQYDLIVISNNLFSRLFDRDNNPLLSVYWKRLIIDEGHSVNSKNSRTSLLCKTLLAERRWAVTGTPTSGLTNLYVDEEEETLKTDSLPKLSKYVIKNTFNEKNDLAKLGNIVSNFLKIEPFHSQQKSWSNLIVKPLLSSSYNAEQALHTLLNDLMVRHNLLDISDNLVLPQLHHEVVYLEPAFHNKLSVNLFAAVLAVNAVTSERTDVDYMFHPSNRMQLRRLITNLQRATFHWTGFTQNDVETLIKICNHALGKKKPDGSQYHTDEDIQLLLKSMEIAKIALSNPQWRTGALLHEMPYYISGLPQAFTRCFGVGVPKSSDLAMSLSVFGAPNLNAIQDFVYKNRFNRFDDNQDFNNKLDESSRTFWNRYWNETLKNNDNKFHKQGTGKDKNEPILQPDIVAAVNTPEIVEGFRPQYLSGETEGDESGSDSDGMKILGETRVGENGTSNFSFNKVRRATVAGTASAKLSYLGARLLEHKQRGVKSIVFYEFEDNAYYLTELLDILGVNYILYATFNKPEQRAQNLSEFSHYDSCVKGGIALIMDLKLASHGLTIIAASRVYFLSPVWKTSIEAQAIKRAHRIGQTQEVHVETLVLRGTLEEEIYSRRTGNHNDRRNGSETYEEQTSESNHAIDDLGIQQYVLRHEFLEFEPAEEERCGFQAPSVYMGEDDVEEESDPYSLLQHQLFVNKAFKPYMRQWMIYLFNQDNLEKLTRTKNQKLLEKESRTDFMNSFVVHAETPPPSATQEKRSSSTLLAATRRTKRVRF